mgnify:CR=1 FL=1
MYCWNNAKNSSIYVNAIQFLQQKNVWAKALEISQKALQPFPNNFNIQLLKAKSLLSTDGIIYIELPDGKNASENGGFIDREEFYLEHYTIFSKDSLDYLVRKIGFGLDEFSSIHEPSDKYTLFAFLKI